MRLIDADAFKEYIKSGIDGLVLPKDQAEKAIAITKSFLKDIDEQPTVNRHQDIVIPVATIDFDEEKLNELINEAAERVKTRVEKEKRPRGEWERVIIVEEPRKNKRAYARCTKCGACFNHYKFAVLHFFFCPICGVDMRKKEGGADNEV